MEITSGKVVSLHYTLSDSEGTFSESSTAGEPLNYLHGANNILPGLETELEGHKAGDKLSVTLAPDAAYGNRVDEATHRVPIKHLIDPGKLQPGMVVALNTKEGPRSVTVVKVGRFNVDVDVNHPLAGKTLTFDIEVLDVREASEEELSHRHVHGPGGHHHD